MLAGDDFVKFERFFCQIPGCDFDADTRSSLDALAGSILDKREGIRYLDVPLLGSYLAADQLFQILDCDEF